MFDELIWEALHVSTFAPRNVLFRKQQRHEFLVLRYERNELDIFMIFAFPILVCQKYRLVAIASTNGHAILDDKRRCHCESNGRDGEI